MIAAPINRGIEFEVNLVEPADEKDGQAGADIPTTLSLQGLFFCYEIAQLRIKYLALF